MFTHDNVRALKIICKYNITGQFPENLGSKIIQGTYGVIAKKRHEGIKFRISF